MEIDNDSVSYKSIDDLTQKAAVSGDEKIPVSGTEYVTVGQIAGMGSGVDVGIVKAWSADNRVVSVRLSGVPKDAVTVASFSVYNAISGEDIAVESVTGSGVDYAVVIAQQTQNYGITFMG